MNGIFVTGTDTGVGKTFIASGIARALRRQGIDLGVMKPAETGCTVSRGVLVPGDAHALMCASQAEDELDIVNPYRFRDPLAPYIAAAREGRSIDIRRITASFRKLRRTHEFLIVEGAGGIMVPLTARKTFLDLAMMMKLPVLIVARPGLGTINHTLLTILALRQRRLPIAGIVINHSENRSNGPSERSNPTVIEMRSGVNVLGIVRYGQSDMSTITVKLAKGVLL